MNVNIVDIDSTETLQPICNTRSLIDCQVGGGTIRSELLKKVENAISALGGPDFAINIRSDFWISDRLLEQLVKSNNTMVVYSDSQDGNSTNKIPMAWTSNPKEEPQKTEIELYVDEDSRIIKYPWDLLYINEVLIKKLSETKNSGLIREGVYIDGNVIVGSGTVILPGVYIEGNVVIGENCKIGPNCYIRGSTHIGNNCHVGQAVEIKNSILMNNVSVGHLSYVGDSVIGEKTNFGAGTVTPNLRHDGANHKSAVNGALIDTTRRKLGVIVGDNVHTGINTTLYPGRKLWPGTMTLPGEIVKKDKKK